MRKTRANIVGNDALVEASAPFCAQQRNLCLTFTKNWPTRLVGPRSSIGSVRKHFCFPLALLHPFQLLSAGSRCELSPFRIQHSVPKQLALVVLPSDRHCPQRSPPRSGPARSGLGCPSLSPPSTRPKSRFLYRLVTRSHPEFALHA